MLSFIISFFLVVNMFAQEQPDLNSAIQPKHVAILIFDGVQIIDYTGPYEVLGQAGLRVFTVAESPDFITTHLQMKVIPSYTFHNSPKVDILVLPGGGVPHFLPKNDPTILWIKKISEQCKQILSVCNGTFFLASAGLLDNLEATTYTPMIQHLKHFAPKTKVVSDKRFVDTGKIITAGGLSAGIDGALHLVSKIYGKGRAREVANNMEYNWNPESEYVRSSLADVHLANVLDFNPPLKRNTLKYEGDHQYWISEFEVIRNESIEEFVEQFNKLAIESGWEKQSVQKQKEKINSLWNFSDTENQKWECEVRIAKNGNNKLVFTLNLNKKE